MRVLSFGAARVVCLLLLFAALVCGTPAGAASLFQGAAQPAMPLIAVSAPGPDIGRDSGSGLGAGLGAGLGRAGGAGAADAAGSLFAGRQGGGLFAPVLPRAERGRLGRGAGIGAGGAFTSALNIPAIVGLRSLIASVEAGSAQYDAVVFSARIKPPKPPTQMSVSEIYDWIAATPGQNHAIGRYQFIPDTLRRVMQEAGADPSARFSPALQDRLADVLLFDAGLPAFLGGHMAQRDFMNNLARIWAGLPNASGKSHYAGIAGNKAGISWARFETEMTRLFPSARRAAGDLG